MKTVKYSEVIVGGIFHEADEPKLFYMKMKGNKCIDLSTLDLKDSPIFNPNYQVVVVGRLAINDRFNHPIVADYP